jgi:DNA replication ATP-dependent helicase Dna2
MEINSRPCADSRWCIGFCVSMMQRLADSNADAIVQLGVQYRMHQDICEISNEIVYKGALKCANAFVATQQVELRGFPDGLTSIQGDATQRGWVERAIHPSTAVIFLNTDTRTQNPDNEASFQPLEHHTVGAGNTGTVNSTEASVVQLIVNAFVSCGMTESDIGVIVPFRAQLRLLNSYSAVVRWKEAGLELSTIDSYQGRDKEVIIISFTRSNTKGRVGRLLEDFRRLNVAVTRAKCKLIMVGSYATLTKGSEVMRPVLERLKNSNMIVDLPTMPVAPTQP